MLSVSELERAPQRLPTSKSVCALTFSIKAQIRVLGFLEEMFWRQTEEFHHFCEVVENGVLLSHWVVGIEQVMALGHVPDLS